jgi:hypothetical protein
VASGLAYAIKSAIEEGRLTQIPPDWLAQTLATSWVATVSALRAVPHTWPTGLWSNPQKERLAYDTWLGIEGLSFFRPHTSM